MYQTNSTLRYTYTRNGVYYFSRWIPNDLRRYYKSDRLVQSLQTRSSSKAKQAASMLASRLDEYWLDLRLRHGSPVFKDKFLISPLSVGSSIVTMTEAKQLYLDLKAKGRSKLFTQASDRTVGYLVSCLGDKPLDEYGGSDASTFREWLISRGLSVSSVRRAFSVIKAIVNLAISELGLEIRNVFTGVYLPEAKDIEIRTPIKGAVLTDIQNQCLRMDDDLRWLVAIVSDTGVRLGEAVGLMLDDLKLDAVVPHVVIRPHKHRSLKTSSSQRLVPLVGVALWAALQIQASCSSEYCFPRYNKTEVSNTNSASAALNKWLKQFAKGNLVVHGFRHGMRDRLRAVDAPSELIDQIGGWSMKTIGQGYGDGYELEQCCAWMRKTVLSTV